MLKSSKFKKTSRVSDSSLARKGLFYIAFSFIVVMLISVFVNTTQVSTNSEASVNKFTKDRSVELKSKCVQKYGFKSDDYAVASILQTCENVDKTSGARINLGSVSGTSGELTFYKCCVTGKAYQAYNDAYCSSLTNYDSKTGKSIGKKTMKCKISCASSAGSTDLNNQYKVASYVRGTNGLVSSICMTADLSKGKWNLKRGTCCSMY